MKTKILLFLLLILLTSFSLYKNSSVSKIAISINNNVLGVYTDVANSISNFINEHFKQASEIRNLRIQNAELEHAATLLSTFANELNQILIDKSSAIYEPKIKLVKSLGYANISDYNKIFITGFDDYNASKIYGLIYQGKSAGIVISKNQKPMAILQTDPKSIFSVHIGNDKIPGVAHGNKQAIIVKYIPQWLSPKIGDEVFTSGLDGIFFSGVLVGKVTNVYDENGYQSAIVEPFVRVNSPSYLYVVIKEK
ncbi:hypothetical protein LMG7974_01265 [Campylobacter majalis]|uniref:Rod shape-determining protein MreC beta-barrel core domain-containing protein n=1 Tax=Campylobacter majalis TaxID=2790656 RepID=A0ABN7K8V2_9BACT|nr:rod shape-determining protein MreC [Campylobacter majalis]CAD7288954.1 hypothetical protein LMG7974_01265 [Campylobacter majalis]